MSPSARHSVSVAAVVVDDAGQVLLTCRRDNGHWEPPGGVLELSESILDSLRREVREETGLEVEADHLTGIYKNMPRGIVALVFCAHIVSGAPAATDEAVRVEWVNRQDVADRCDEAYAVRVFDALDNDRPAVRAHDGVSLLRDRAALPS